jgi:hypothetical protein
VPIKSFYSDLDKWVRRRIRMCIWKQWKTGRTRAAALLKLGVPEHEAYTLGMSSEGLWVLSSSQAVHQALSTALLEARGLPSLLAIWKKLTAKSRTDWFSIDGQRGPRLGRLDAALDVRQQGRKVRTHRGLLSMVLQGYANLSWHDPRCSFQRGAGRVWVSAG